MAGSRTGSQLPAISAEAVKGLLEEVEQSLLPGLELESVAPFDPIVVRRQPEPWQLLGAGNYAAVLLHPTYSSLVVKVYAPGRPGIEEEAEVYRRLGRHEAYSECYHVGSSFLILRRLTGVTLYQCLLRGIPIPRQVLRDVDAALDYARQQGLHPHDVHGKNVMLQEGRGIVVDVSDFLKEEPCFMWEDLKTAYNRFYFPIFRELPIPELLLTAVRKLYRRLGGGAKRGSGS